MNHIRHSDIHKSPPPITLIGLGGIGSPLALLLAKMGCPELVVFDDDVVDEENLPTQLHPMSSVGVPKVTSTRLAVEHYSDETNVDIWPIRIDNNTPPTTIVNPIVISAVDKIDTRQDIWTVVGRSKTHWYIDMRMAAEQVNIYIVNMREDASWYSDFLFNQNDEDIPDLPCTSKATIYCGMTAAAHAGNIVKRITMRQEVPHILVHNIPENSLLEIK